MGHQPLGIRRGKGVVELNGHIAFADGRVENLGAEGAGAGIDGDLVAGLQAGFLPDQVEGFDLLRKLAVRNRGSAEVAQRRTVPTVADSALEKLDEVVDFNHFIT